MSTCSDRSLRYPTSSCGARGKERKRSEPSDIDVFVVDVDGGLFLCGDLFGACLEGSLLDLDPAERVDRLGLAVDRTGEAALDDGVDERLEGALLAGLLDHVDHDAADRLLLARVRLLGRERDGLDLDAVVVRREDGDVRLDLRGAASHERTQVVTGQGVFLELRVCAVAADVVDLEAELRV